MEPPDFLPVSDYLIERGDGPCCRSAISRAYYGPYHAGASHLRRIGIRLPADEGGRPGDEHAFVIRCLRRSGDPEVVKAGDQLRVLLDWRRVADYRLQWQPDDPSLRSLTDPESPECAAQRVAETRQIIATLDAVFSDDNRRLRIKRRLADLQASGRL